VTPHGDALGEQAAGLSLSVEEAQRPITPDEWRDALERFLHAYLLNNEPQVHPRSLATAVWDWLHSQSPPYEAAIQQLEQERERADNNALFFNKAEQRIKELEGALEEIAEKIECQPRLVIRGIAYRALSRSEEEP
jgi:hypothetical protein